MTFLSIFTKWLENLEIFFFYKIVKSGSFIIHVLKISYNVKRCKLLSIKRLKKFLRFVYYLSFVRGIEFLVKLPGFAGEPNSY